MKVILKENVKNLGKMGETVNVADGYATNYLIPRQLAVEAITKNIKALEHQKKAVQEKAKKVKTSAEDLSSRISSLDISLTAKAGEEEKLFGSITSMDIADALKKQGIEIDRKKILLEEPIKRLGSYTIGIKIHPDVISQLTIKVVPE